VGLSPGIETEPDNCGFCGVRGDHPGAPGGGAAVPSQAGFDVDLLIVPIETLRSNPSLGLAPLRVASGVEMIDENWKTGENCFYVAAQLLQGILCKLIRDLLYS